MERTVGRQAEAPMHVMHPAPRVHMLEGSAGAMAVHVYEPTGRATGCALVAHGRNGATDQAQIVRMIDACLSRQWRVYAPELCHSAANESAGEARRFTMAAHTADVRTVLSWLAALGEDAAPDKMVLLGHSMGAYAVIHAAASAPQPKVSGVIAVSPVVSGSALLEARQAMGEAAISMLRDELPQAFEEWPTHSLADIAPRVSVPAAVIVGADDSITPPADAMTLAGWLTDCVWRDVIPGEHHCPTGEAFSHSLAAALDRIAPG